MGAIGVQDQAQAENADHRAACGRLLAVAESYPELKANQNFLALQEELIGTESKIAYARQFYNDQVARLNTLIEIVPVEPGREAFGTSSTRRSSTSTNRSEDRCRSTSSRPCTSRSRRTSARRSCLWSSRSCFWRAVGYAIGFVFGTGSVGLAIAVAVALAAAIGVVLLGRQARARLDARQRGHGRRASRACTTSWRAWRSRPACRSRAVYVVPEQAPNAFATGRDPEHSSVAVTAGPAGDLMNRVELEGVIGHEMAHVVDRDILLRHDRRDRGRRRRPDLGVLPAELVVGRDRRSPERSTANGGGVRADPVRGGVRAPDPRADSSGS